MSCRPAYKAFLLIDPLLFMTDPLEHAFELRVAGKQHFRGK